MDRIRSVVFAISEQVYQFRRKGATLALCLLATWVAYHAIFGANGMMIYSQKRTEHRALNQEILDLRQENDRLAHHVESLQNDPKAIEKEAREQLRYARPGEVIYTLPQSAPKTGMVTAEKR